MRKGVEKWGVPLRVNGLVRKDYDQWASLRKRCRATGNNAQHYSECSYVPEWDSFTEYLEWAEKQIGFLVTDELGWIYELDKDILVKGNKTYCPELCVFVPKEINTFYLKIKRSRGTTPIGVTWNKKGEVFIAQINENKVNKYLGSYSTARAAHDAYVSAKVAQAKQLAVKYSGLVDPRVTDALNNFNVSIDD